MKFKKLIVIVSLLSISSIFAAPLVDNHELILIPNGGGDSGNNRELMEIIINNSIDKSITILVLPIMSELPSADYLENLQTDLQSSCDEAVGNMSDCTVNVNQNINQFNILRTEMSLEISNEVSAILMMSSSASEAMDLLAGSELEKSIDEAYHRGVIISGIGEAGNMLSRAMIAGYSPGSDQGNTLQFGSVNVWNNEGERGLSFGSEQSIIDNQVFRAGNFSRLLHAITLPESPKIGIGIDSYSGLVIRDDSQLENTFGEYPIAVIDSETYQAANGILYRGSKNFYSLRNVLVHLVASGDYSYNLINKQHSLAAPIQELTRESFSMPIPEGAGTILLSDHFEYYGYGTKLLERFVNIAGGQQAKLSIIISGYATDRSARNIAEQYQQWFSVPTTLHIITRGSNDIPPLPDDLTGIMLVGRDASAFLTNRLPDIQSKWLGGTPILAIGAGASVLGPYYTSLEPTPHDLDEAEAYTQGLLLAGENKILPGLGLVDFLVEPGIIESNHWSRLFSLAFNYPEFVALGLNQNSTIVISQNSIKVEGENSIFSLDLRSAALDYGENNEYVIANGLMDVFAPGDLIQFQSAITQLQLIHASTPILPITTHVKTTPSTPTPTLTFTPTQTEKPKTPSPTRTPRPTPMIPPPTDTNLTYAMIIVGVFAVIAVFIGYWINRRYL